MLRFEAFQEIKVVLNEKDIITSKLKLKFKNFKSIYEEVKTSRVKFPNIDAEWWVTLGPLKSRAVDRPAHRSPTATNSAYTQHVRFYESFFPLKFDISIGSEEVLAFPNCSFDIEVQANHLTKVYSNDWSEVSKIRRLWSPNIDSAVMENHMQDLDLSITFKIRSVEKPTLKNRFYDPNVVLDTLVSKFSDMMSDESFCDFTVVVKEKEFKVHKNVLAAQSPYFKSLFLSNMQEARDNISKIEICEPEIFQQVLKFIYTAKLPRNFETNAKKLYETANYFGIETLKDVCLRQVCFHLSVENAVDLYQWAWMYDLEDLKRDAWDVVKRDVMKVYFKMKEEPLSPDDLKEFMSFREREQKFLDRFKELSVINEEPEEVQTPTYKRTYQAANI